MDSNSRSSTHETRALLIRPLGPVAEKLSDTLHYYERTKTCFLSVRIIWLSGISGHSAGGLISKWGSTIMRAGHSSGCRVPRCKSLDHPSILYSGCICSLSYFPFQPVPVHNWSIKGCGMFCPVCGKVHIKDPLTLIRRISLCGDIGFPLKKYITVTIYMLEVQ